MTRKLLLTLIIVAAVGAACGIGTYSAFSSSTTTSSNSFSAGTVSISDDHTASAWLNLTNASPGTTTSGCIKVTYGGSLSSAVRMYATVSGSLAQYLKLTVTRGSGATFGTSCSGFTTTGEGTYVNLTPGVTFSGTLDAFPTSYAGASNDPAGGTTDPWTNGESHVYKIDVQLDPAAPNAAQGLSANASFTWEAQNQ